MEQPLESRPLVVWISAGILGFQGGSLVLDLIHCSVLSWLCLRRYGLELVVTAGSLEQWPPQRVGASVAEEAVEPQAPASTDQRARRSRRSLLQPRPPATGWTALSESVWRRVDGCGR